MEASVDELEELPRPNHLNIICSICMSEIDTGISITTSKNHTKLIYCRSPTIFRVSIVEMCVSTFQLAETRCLTPKVSSELLPETQRLDLPWPQHQNAAPRSITVNPWHMIYLFCNASRISLGQLFNISLSQVAVHIWDHPTKTASFWLL